MNRLCPLYALAMLVCLPVIAGAEDARSIFESAQKKQLERWRGVNLYMIDQSIMSNSVQSYYRRTEVKSDDGNVQTLFLPVTERQLATSECTDGAVQMTPEALDAYGDALESVGAGMGEEIESGLEDAGLPRGLLAASGSSPTATLDPRVMMGSMATFARAGADAQRMEAGHAERDASSARQSAEEMLQFIETARLVGTEAVDGRQAYHLRSDQIGQVQQVEGGEYRMDSLSMWIDTSEYVPLRTKVEGTMTSGGESKPMVIETVQSDYRQVPGSRMYESYKRSMSISGTMTAEQEAQVQEAMQEMAKLEKQMASMPAAQRQMMEKMMGPQLATMRSMASGGGIQTEVIVNSITVNPTVATQGGMPCSTGGTAAAAAMQPAPGETAAAMSEGMVVMIQESLVKLGYAPGNTSGDLTRETVIAITKFEAANDMPVTGTPTPQLAGILAARADARN